MKNTLFTQLYTKPSYPCFVQLSSRFDLIMDLQKECCLELYSINVGYNSIDLFTNPYKHIYIEYHVYQGEEEYELQKTRYQEFIQKNANEIQVIHEGKMTCSKLSNGLRATLCMNDKERLLLWETERTHITSIDPMCLLSIIEGKGTNSPDCEKDLDKLIMKNRNQLNEDGGLRFDGLYVLNKKKTAEYLRFFPNGKVVGFLSCKNDENFLKNLLEEEYEEFGCYSLTEKGIAFKISFLEGNLSVAYKGLVGGNKLTLFRKINDSSMPRQLGVYRFIPMNYE